MRDEPDNEDEIEYVSKSQLKRESQALQVLGEKLTQLSQEQLQQLDIPETLRSAVLEAKSISKHGAKRRQIQYVGRIMRNIDAAKIQQQLEKLTLNSTQAISQLHKIEKWRERLLTEGETALTEFIDAYPHTDRQQLRLLIRNTRSESKQNKPPRSFRKLFQLIKYELDR